MTFENSLAWLHAERLVVLTVALQMSRRTDEGGKIAERYTFIDSWAGECRRCIHGGCQAVNDRAAILNLPIRGRAGARQGG